MFLKISLAQMEVRYGDPEANYEKTETLLAQAAEAKSDLVLFPEMWTTGFDWQHNRALSPEASETIERLGSLAKQHSLWIHGSVYLPREPGHATNTSLLFDSQGNLIASYDKAHLFSYHEEEKHVQPGQSLVLAETPWGKWGLSICYDIRFPEMFRHYALKGACLILSPIAFPHPRLEHWQTLFRARAIENQLFMASSNHVGEKARDGQNLRFFGHSSIVGPWGESVIEASEGEEGLYTATIDLSEVARVRAAMRVFDDRRPDLY